jgi:hypothetical protein
MSDRTLPPLLAMSDELDRLERKADADVGDELDEVRSRLDEYAARERGDERDSDGRDSLLDDVDETLLRLRERLSGEADRQAEALQNRIQQFRNARSGSSDTLSLSDPRLVDGESRIDVAEYGGRQVDVVATLVNAGETGEGVVRVGFFDEDGTLARRVDHVEEAVDAGEQRDVTTTVTVPDGVTHYDVSVVDGDVA